MSEPTTMPIVGVIGAGQLARMMQPPAVALGVPLRVLAHGEGEPATQVIPQVRIGAADDAAAIREFAGGTSAVTFDHEHVPQSVLAELGAAGVNLQPGGAALRHAQDKLVLRRRCEEMGIAQPRYAAVEDVTDVLRFGSEHGWPCVLKAARGGYDGKGVWRLNTPEGARSTVTELLEAGTPLLVEQAVPMRAELAVLVARSPFGQGALWPVTQTVQRDGICVQTVTPAPELDAETADYAGELALRIAEELGVTGVMAVELFQDSSGRLLVNELAMRPHNSGHWSIDGAATSQFEQHLRAVLDYPLGETSLLAPVTVMGNVLGAAQTPRMAMDERVHHLLARYPGARVQLYGKAERAGRKIGHVTLLGRDAAHGPDLSRAADLAAGFLASGQWSDGWDPHG